MTLADRMRRCSLRVVGGGVERGADWPTDRALVDGQPAIVGKVGGFPLELRVWRRPPPPEFADAVYHMSGAWVCVRAMDKP